MSTSRIRARARAPRRLICLAAATAIATAAMPQRVIRAQSQDSANNPYDGDGLHENRSYLSLLPYEHIDTLNGNLVLTFTDVVLPGNAGFELRFQRTYNSKRSALWSFGLAGIPMRVLNAEHVTPPNIGDEPLFPILVTADGGRHPARPVTQTETTHFGTKEFWRYHRDGDTVELPNGLVGTYGFIDDRNIAPGVPSGNNVRYLTAITDPFGNSVTLTWTMTAWVPVLTEVVQELGNDQRRTVTLGFQDGGLVSSIGVNGRTWTYLYDEAWRLKEAIPPVGPKWKYDYTNGVLTQLTTPHGGIVEYGYGPHVFEWRDMKLGETRPITTRVLQLRKIGTAQWSYAYPALGTPQETVITGPSSIIKVLYEYPGGVDPAVRRRTILELDGTTIRDTETIGYHPLPFVDWGPLGDDNRFAAPNQRTIQRDGSTWTTTHSYAAANYGDFGQPWRTEESGTAGTRTITREFTHDFTPWIRGRVTKETVTQDGRSFETSAAFDDATGFRTSQTTYGIAATFAPTVQGNVASATHVHGTTPHTTSFGYSWGAVSSITTPEYAIARVINQTGTIASETRRGLQTSFTYDSLDRVTRVDVPEGDATVTNYDNTGGGSVTVHRGPSWVQTHLDGFGRPTGTTNVVGIKTAVQYDAEGRRTFESLPYTGTPPEPPGDRFSYDGLGRVTRVAHTADGSDITIDFNGLQQTITDEKDRVTVQEWVAFGDPGDARLATLRDAADETWRYSYNALGSLTEVDAPGEHGTRTWSYDSRNLLASEIHPESGTTTYDYDSAGRLESKTDARGQVFTYHYDGNDRVREIRTPGQSAANQAFTYDASDNRRTLSSGAVTTTFGYDGANRVTVRTDSIAGRSVTVAYGYDGRDNLTTTTYPSGRVVTQDYDAANRVTKVFDAERTYAEAFTYHPSGPLAQYVAGNGLQHTLTLDNRQRVETIHAGPLALRYGYDLVGNVTSIDDLSDRNRDSGFGYDALDRLTSVTGFGATTYTYDALGNRKTTPGVTYVYDDPKQRLTHDGTASYQHDAVGNTTVAGTSIYGYSPFNTLTSATVTGATTTYAYDADGQRRLRVGATGTEYFVHGPAYVPLAEFQDVTGALQWQRDYIYAGSRLIASVAPGTGGSTSYTFSDDPLVAGMTAVRAVHLTELRGAINAARALWSLPAATWTDTAVSANATPIRLAHLAELRAALDEAYVAANATLPSYTDPTLTTSTPIKAAHFQQLRDAIRGLPAPAGGGVSYYHLDALGSVRAVTAPDRTVVRRHDYLPFGEEYQPESGADARRFTGKERDAETGLDYFGARYLPAPTGRFLSVDPVQTWKESLADPQRWNRYAYVRNNPGRFVDPDGRAIETIWDLANVGIGIGSLVRNVATGNVVGAIVDVGGLVVDTGATVIPGLPGGASSAIRAGRLAENVRFGKAFESAVLNALDLMKNTRRIDSATAAYRIPDAFAQGILLEVKGVKRLDLTDQVRDFINAAKAENRKVVIVVRHDTRIAKQFDQFLDNGHLTILRVAAK